jgi:predicted RNase H-like nuclease
MTPELQGRVYEVHPELCFWALSGGRPLERKKSVEGRGQRRRLLRRIFPSLPGEPRLAAAVRGVCRPDDYLDALAAAAAGLAIARGRAVRIPVEAACDGRGLRMEVWIVEPESREPRTLDLEPDHGSVDCRLETVPWPH